VAPGLTRLTKARPSFANVPALCRLNVQWMSDNLDGSYSGELLPPPLSGRPVVAAYLRLRIEDDLPSLATGVVVGQLKESEHLRDGIGPSITKDRERQSRTWAPVALIEANAPSKSSTLGM
jgi:hypothetical protein